MRLKVGNLIDLFLDNNKKWVPITLAYDRRGVAILERMGDPGYHVLHSLPSTEPTFAFRVLRRLGARLGSYCSLACLGLYTWFSSSQSTSHLVLDPPHREFGLVFRESHILHRQKVSACSDVIKRNWD